ncbi:MAG: DNA-binding protein, partial [Chloroflexi bacterium]|nr:DNA-binding protein [Chloroflexota bacterium]
MAVSPAVLEWAIERSGKDRSALYQRFTRLSAWESGEAAPTLRQLEDFAKATYVPVGYFFLSEPPVEEIPIPDLRTIDNKGVVRPSANLLDTIYICQRRQDWYREYAISIREEPLSLIGSANINRPAGET